MGKQRYISTSFWKDDFVGELTPPEKLLYMYLLTNGQTNIAGVYKLQIREIMFDTGLGKTEIVEVFNRLETSGKAKYIDEWVIIPNFPKHQRWEERENIHKGIVAILRTVPEEILSECNSLGYQFPLDTIHENVRAVRVRMGLHKKRQGSQGGGTPEEPEPTPEELRPTGEDMEGTGKDSNYKDINSDLDSDSHTDPLKDQYENSESINLPGPVDNVDNSLPPPDVENIPVSGDAPEIPPDPGKVGEKPVERMSKEELRISVDYHIEDWNLLAKEAKKRGNRNMPVFDRTAEQLERGEKEVVVGAMKKHPRDDIQRAREIFCDIGNQPDDYHLSPTPHGFLAFMSYGIEPFLEGSDPYTRCRRPKDRASPGGKICPVCNTRLIGTQGSCSNCGLDWSNRNDPAAREDALMMLERRRA